MLEAILKRAWLLLFLFVPFPARSDVIILKNQKHHKGKVVSQNSEAMLLREASGRVLSIPKRAIRRVLYLPDEEMRKMDEVAQGDRRARAEAETNHRAERAREQKERQDREERARVALLQAEHRQRKERDRRQAQATAEDRSARLAAVWRSALLPGWGQVHRGDSEWGAGIVGAWFGGLVLWRRFDVLHSSAVVRLERATTVALLGFDTPLVAYVGSREAGQASREANRYGTRAQRVSIALLCVYVVNVAQAWAGRAPKESRTGWDIQSGDLLAAAEERVGDGARLLRSSQAFQFRYSYAH